MNRACLICGKSLEEKRADAKTCGPTCRNVLSAERKKTPKWVRPPVDLARLEELLEKKLSGIEKHIASCRSFMAGESRQLKRGSTLRLLFEIEEAARSIFPDLDMAKSYKQREEDRYALLQKMGWI